MPDLVVVPGAPLRGRIRVPGDKSISHRALILGAVAEGVTRVSGFLPGGDCRATLECLRDLGVRAEVAETSRVTVHGVGLRGLRPPARSLDCARSGTTMRLLAGLLAGQAFGCTLTGEAQLLRRPMERVAAPLRAMGADIGTTGGHPPLTIRAARLRGADHRLPVASAQVKSALLLAGLQADGMTTVHEPAPSRDHTERMLRAMGADLDACGLTATIRGGGRLRSLDIDVPGDLSSAAFPIVAALLVPGSEVTVTAVGVNPTRTGLLDVLARMQAAVATANADGTAGGEPVADLTARASPLAGSTIAGELVGRMIDEFPVLAVAATQAAGVTTVSGARELRVKETDRIETVVAELRKLGARIDAHADGFVVEGPARLHGGEVDSHGDHRLAMALAVAGLVADGPVTVQGIECAGDSFPGFVPLMRTLGARYEVTATASR